jgi:hypothetical protein
MDEYDGITFAQCNFNSRFPVMRVPEQLLFLAKK